MSLIASAYASHFVDIICNKTVGRVIVPNFKQGHPGIFIGRLPVEGRIILCHVKFFNGGIAPKKEIGHICLLGIEGQGTGESNHIGVQCGFRWRGAKPVAHIPVGCIKVSCHGFVAHMLGHHRVMDPSQGKLSRFDPIIQFIQYLLGLPGKIGDHGFAGLHRPVEAALFRPPVGLACKIHGHFDAHLTNIPTHKMVIVGIPQVVM